MKQSAEIAYLLTLIMPVITDIIIEVVVDYISTAPFRLMPPPPPGNQIFLAEFYILSPLWKLTHNLN